MFVHDVPVAHDTLRGQVCPIQNISLLYKRQLIRYLFDLDQITDIRLQKNHTEFHV